MRILFSLFLFLLSQNVFCQFGVRTSYNLNNASGWDEYFANVTGDDPDVFKNSLSFTLDYWLKLPNHRIEFYPYLSYHSANSKFGFSYIIPPAFIVDGVYNLGFRQIGGGLLTHFYILDMVGDCECPTFSKQGGMLKKGLFLVAGLGTDYSQKAVEGNYRDGNFDFKASLGVGLDVGVNDLITISPYIQFQYYPHVSWHELGENLGIDNADVETSLGQYQFGIRLGFRPDYKRNFSR